MQDEGGFGFEADRCGLPLEFLGGGSSISRVSKITLPRNQAAQDTKRGSFAVRRQRHLLCIRSLRTGMPRMPACRLPPPRQPIALRSDVRSCRGIVNDVLIIKTILCSCHRDHVASMTAAAFRGRRRARAMTILPVGAFAAGVLLHRRGRAGAMLPDT